MSENCWKCAQAKVGGTPCALHAAALPPVRSEPLLAAATSALDAWDEFSRAFDCTDAQDDMTEVCTVYYSKLSDMMERIRKAANERSQP